MRFQANFLSLSRTLSISNKYFGPLKVRDREILLYITVLSSTTSYPVSRKGLQILKSFQISALVEPTKSICRRYRGTVCELDTFDIPAGKTDAQIDQELRELTKDHQPKLSICKRELQKAICNMIYGTCGFDGEKNPLKPLKTCRSVCEWFTNDSMCYQELPAGSRVKAWLDQQDCNSYPTTEDSRCASFHFTKGK